MQTDRERRVRIVRRPFAHFETHDGALFPRYRFRRFRNGSVDVDLRFDERRHYGQLQRRRQVRHRPHNEDDFLRRGGFAEIRRADMGMHGNQRFDLYVRREKRYGAPIDPWKGLVRHPVVRLRQSVRLCERVLRRVLRLQSERVNVDPRFGKRPRRRYGCLLLELIP